MKENENRLHLRNAVIGVNGTGKSSFIEKLLKAYDLKTQKVLIICETNPPAYAKYKRVADYEELKRWKSGVVKFYDYTNDDDENGPFRMLGKLRDLCNEGYISNGAVVLEDCTNYVDSNPSRSVKAFIINHRMWDLDLFLATHSLELFPPFMRKFMHTITLFKTGDSLYEEKDMKKLKYMNYQAMWAAYSKAKEEFAKGNKHFYITVPTGL